MKITLRPISESDDPFLSKLYASTRAAEMALVPWTDSEKRAFLEMQFHAQKTSYAKEYPEALHAVICRDGESVGYLYLNRSEDRFHILDITVADSCRNQGIGCVVLREILQEANGVGKPTTIYVENFNPSLRLFERLGFRVAAVKDFQTLLERRAGPLNGGVGEPGSA